MLYGTITEQCTTESCPVMSAGPKYDSYLLRYYIYSFFLSFLSFFPSSRYEYHWADGTTVKKPIKCSAPKYIDYLMTWVQEQLDDEAIFPSKIGMQGSILFGETDVCACMYEENAVMSSLLFFPWGKRHFFIIAALSSVNKLATSRMSCHSTSLHPVN